MSDRLPAVVFTIRCADLADAAGIAAVQVASWRTTYHGIVAQEYIDRLSVAVFTRLG